MKNQGYTVTLFAATHDQFGKYLSTLVDPLSARVVLDFTGKPRGMTY
jgi:hypothetical protein